MILTRCSPVPGVDETASPDVPVTKTWGLPPPLRLVLSSTFASELVPLASLFPATASASEKIGKRSCLQ